MQMVETRGVSIWQASKCNRVGLHFVEGSFY